MAKEFGVSAPLVAYYERNTTNPTAEVVLRLAAFFKVPSSYFLDEKPVPLRKETPGPMSEIEQRMAKLRKLPKAKQRLLVRMLDAFIADSA